MLKPVLRKVSINSRRVMDGCKLDAGGPLPGLSQDCPSEKIKDGRAISAQSYNRWVSTLGQGLSALAYSLDNQIAWNKCLCNMDLGWMSGLCQEQRSV